MSRLDKYIIDTKIKTIPIRMVCDALHLERKQKRYQCVNPNHIDKHPSMTIYEKSNTWYCFACGEHGSVIDMVQSACNCNFIEACEWLAHNFGISLPNTTERQKLYHGIKPIKKTLKNNIAIPNPIIDHELLEWIVSNAGLSNTAESFLFGERKLSRDTIKYSRVFSLNDETKFIENLVSRFGENRCIASRILKKNQNGRLYSCYIFPALAFPYFDYEGKIVNIQSRTFFPQNPSERFRNIPGLPVIPFNLQSLKSLESGSMVYIAEGVTDCLALLSEGNNAIAIPGANSYKDEFAKYLDRFVLIMFPDNDKSGSTLYEKMSNSMKCSIFRRNIPNGFKDYSDYHVNRYE